MATSTSSGGVKTPGTSSAGSQQSGVQIPITDLTFSMTEAALVQAMEKIPDEDIRNLMSLVEAVTQEEIQKLDFSALEYQGFDPLIVRLALLAANKAHSETFEVLRDDIMWMIAVNIYMGNIQTKAHSRRSIRGRTIVSALMKKYNLKTGSTGTGHSSTVLTFPRIAATFPVLSTRMANVLPTKRFSPAPFKSGTVPSFMCIASFCSLVDDKCDEQLKKFLLECHAAYSSDQTLTIAKGEARKARAGRKAEEMSALEAFSTQWPYIEAASRGPVPNGDMRRAMIVEFKLDEMYSTLSPIVLNLRTLVGDPQPILPEEEYKAKIAAYITSSPDISKIR